MHLDIVHLAAGDVWAGAEVLISQLVSAQRLRRDITVSAILLNEGRLADELRGSASSLSIVPEHEMSFRGMVAKARDTVRTLKCPIIHTHGLKQTLLATALRQMGVQATLVRTVHGYSERDTSLRSKALNRLERSAADRVFSLHVAVSPQLEKDLRRHHPTGRVTYIPNGIDESALYTGTSTTRPVGGPFRVGFVGRLVRVKRVDLFLRAAKLMTERTNHRIEFIICGEGPEEATLRMLASELSITNLHFAGFASNGARVIASLDALVLTSDSEGMPMTILEAAALGVPIVSRDVGAVSEVVGGQQGASFVKSASPEHIAAAMESVLNDYAAAVDRARRVRNHVLAQYSATAMEQRYYAEYVRVTRKTMHTVGE